MTRSQSLNRVALWAFAAGILAIHSSLVTARDPDEALRIWPGMAPGETTLEEGTVQPFRPEESPPVTRVTDITCPTLDVYLPHETAVQAVVLILPGGGFGKVVPDKEGSEAAVWLNEHGVACGVLRYRTSLPGKSPAWERPWQDSQRAMRLMRYLAKQWDAPDDRIGLLGFSAGGQVAAIHLSRPESAYDPVDDRDALSARPDFALLIYPWNLIAPATDQLIPPIRISASFPPTFLVHTHDDNASSLSSVLVYAGLKQHGVPAELHIYQTGGHGYGLRRVAGSDIHTWPDRATQWLRIRGIIP